MKTDLILRYDPFWHMACTELNITLEILKERIGCLPTTIRGCVDDGGGGILR